MTNPIQKIIEEAKARGFVPEKKESSGIGAIPETNDYANGWNDCRKEAFKAKNRAIDSYNLEKVIELAYEKGRGDMGEETENKVSKILIMLSDRKGFDGWFDDIDEEFQNEIKEDMKNIITNLSTNKEE